MPLYRNAAGELREFPQDAFEVHEPVYHFRGYHWNPHARDPHAREPMVAVEREIQVWQRVRVPGHPLAKED